MKKAIWLLAGFLLFGCIAAVNTRPFEGAVRYSDEMPTGDAQYFEHNKPDLQFQYYKDGKWYMANGIIRGLSDWKFKQIDEDMCVLKDGHKYQYRSHSTMYGKKGPIYYFECSRCSHDRGFFSSELTPEQITALKELNYYVD